jgi:hypothetical protein
MSERATDAEAESASSPVDRVLADYTKSGNFVRSCFADCVDWAR